MCVFSLDWMVKTTFLTDVYSDFTTRLHPVFFIVVLIQTQQSGTRMD